MGLFFSFRPLFLAFHISFLSVEKFFSASTGRPRGSRNVGKPPRTVGRNSWVGRAWGRMALPCPGGLDRRRRLAAVIALIEKAFICLFFSLLLSDPTSPISLPSNVIRSRSAVFIVPPASDVASVIFALPLMSSYNWRSRCSRLVLLFRPSDAA